MASFNSSAQLQHKAPSTTKKVLSTTSQLSAGIESDPVFGTWWIRNFGVGQRQKVKYVTRKAAPENRYTSIRFKTSSGATPIVDLNFAGGGSAAALVVAAGPRVSLYGGANRTAGTSDFGRALKAGSASQRRREAREDDEESVDLFGGRFKKKGNEKSDDGLDDIGADRKINTGGQIAECASHRSDGKLVAIGTRGGNVKICDVNSRATLRTFGNARSSGGGDRKAVRSTSWLRDGKRVAAGGDDGVVRVWNISGGLKDGGIGDEGSGAEITLRGHGDKVTAIKVLTFRKDEVHHLMKRKGQKRSRDETESFSSSSWSQHVISGSYDHTIRVWDIESEKERGVDRCVSIMDHEDPVQALLVIPPTESDDVRSSKLDSIPLLVSAGGTTLKIWNPFSGSCLGTFQTKHAKTITSLCLLDATVESEDNEIIPSQRMRHIITGGLDGLLRIHSARLDDILSGNLPFLHGMQIIEPISSLALSPSMERLAIGTTSGIVVVHQRRRTAAAKPAREYEEPRHGTYAYFNRGAHEKSHDTDDYLLQHHKKQKLSEYDLLLRKFRYGDALDAALAKRQPKAVIAVIEELGKRMGLRIALSNRDEESLDAIMSFTVRFIDDPQYCSHLTGVAHILCDIYGSLIGQSPVVDELFAKLKDRVSNECVTQRMILRMLGQIDLVTTQATMHISS